MALRKHPVVSVGYQEALRDETDYQRAAINRASYDGTYQDWPLQHLAYSLPVTYAAGSTQINFTSAAIRDKWFDLCPKAAVYSLYFSNFFVSEIASRSLLLNRIILSDPLPFDANAGFFVAPVFEGLMQDQLSSNFRFNSGSSQINFEVSREAMFSTSTDELTFFDGLPVMDVDPLVNPEVATAFSFNSDPLDYGTSNVINVLRATSGRHIQSRSYKIGTEGLRYWRQLFSWTRGSARELLIPTFRKDVDPFVTPATGQPEIEVNNSEYVNAMLQSAKRQYLMFETSSGRQYYKIDSTTVNGSNRLVITLTSNITDNTISYISLVDRAILLDDAVTIVYYATHKIVQFATETVT